MKVKGIPYSDVKATLLQDPDVLSAYLAEKKKEERTDPIYQDSFGSVQ
ncbi:hypothetical protein [Xenorhabdus entomophaga]